MTSKRTKKNQKRDRRRKADRRKDRRRTERLSAPLMQEEGQQAITWLDDFLSNYRKDNRPEDFPTALTLIRDLNLLQLEDHKYAMTAAVATIYRMHPEYQKAWREEFRQTILRSERLYPEQEDLELKLEQPYQVDQALMDWMVSGDMSRVDAVVDLAGKPTELGEEAEKILAFYVAQFPELKRHLKKPKGSTFRNDAQQQKQAKDLVAIIQQSPQWHKVALVHYWDGEFIVASMDGSPVEGLPITWEGHRVVVRKATPLEVAGNRAWRNRMEDPV